MKTKEEILIKYHRNPSISEINFGHGAIHYCDFSIKDCKGKDGEPKKWFVSAYDGKRYYKS